MDSNQSRLNLWYNELSLAVPFYRYWNGKNHFYTTNKNEIGTTTPGTIGHYNYTFERVECLIHANQVVGSVPLYRYFQYQLLDHFYTTDADEIGTTTRDQFGKHGYRSEGVSGYCFPLKKPDTVPLYRYRYIHSFDHLYTTEHTLLGNLKKYRPEGVTCYVYPATGKWIKISIIYLKKHFNLSTSW